MKLRKPTLSYRATVAQEARYILGPDEQARGWREVQVVVPEGNLLYCGIDVVIQGPMEFGPTPSGPVPPFYGRTPPGLPAGHRNVENAVRHVVDHMAPDQTAELARVDQGPRKIGPNRNYQMPLLAPGAQIKFTLQPQQWLTAMAETGLVYATLFVEFLEE